MGKLQAKSVVCHTNNKPSGLLHAQLLFLHVLTYDFAGYI